VSSQDSRSSRDFSRWQQPRVGWSIHVVTASGLALGMLALIAVLDNNPKAALLWLTAAQVLDGVDGPVARACDVRNQVPRIDGFILDLVVDFVTCVVVPAAFLYRFDLVPKVLAGPIVGLVLATTALWFSRTDIQGEDHWFRGFPGVWNLIVPSLYLLSINRTAAALIVAGLAIAQLTDLPFVHPVRVKDLRSITLPVMVAWIAALTVGVLSYPDAPAWMATVLLACPTYFIGLSLRQRIIEGRIGRATPVS
jgi:phosphatidylcholine synthase